MVSRKRALAQPLVWIVAGLIASSCADGEDPAAETPVIPNATGDAAVGGGSSPTGGGSSPTGTVISPSGGTGTSTGIGASSATGTGSSSDGGAPTGTGTSPGTSSDGGARPDGGGTPVEAGLAMGPAGGVTAPPETTTPPCSGKPGAKKGKVSGMVMAGGLARTFVYYAPPNLDPNKPAPLVISPHGFTMLGEDMFVLTGYKELADREGFVAIFPDGGGVAPWNVGEGINGVGVAVGADHDDQAFVDAMIKYVDDDRCLDKKHIFVSGFSMGGYFSNEAACVRSDIAGVAPHSGGSHDLASCKGTLKPVIILHGTVDWLILYENGIETRDRWVKRNGCSMEADKVQVTMGTCEYYKNCKPGAQVAMCSFDGLSHSWAGGSPHLFSTQGYAESSQLAWSFWRKYAW